MMQQKEKLESVDNDKILELSHIFLFPRLQEYNQFHIYDNVPSPKNFPMWIFVPL